MGRYLDMAEQALAKQANEAKKGKPTPKAAPEAPDPCSECGSTSWAIALVDDALNRVCYDCLTGATAMRRRGVPF